MDEYLELASRHQYDDYAKPYQKQYQKKNAHQALPHHEPSYEHEYETNKLKKEVALTPSEVLDCFWKELVQLGWRINADFNKIDRKNSVQFMFLCTDCGKSLHCQQSHTITPTRLKSMKDKNWLSLVLKKHKTDTSRGCAPEEYDENGEVISEA
jgi:hypothetical protein